MPAKYTPEERIAAFWKNVAVVDEDDCWEWQRHRSKEGYGNVRWLDSKQKTHRMAYYLFYGDFDRNLKVLHRCDNPPCCNPKHLFLGTDADNSRDREAKGRGKQPKGEANAGHKLTYLQVQEIRQRYAIGDITKAALSREYCVSQTTIGRIIRRKNWR